MAKHIGDFEPRLPEELVPEDWYFKAHDGENLVYYWRDVETGWEIALNTSIRTFHEPHSYVSLSNRGDTGERNYNFNIETHHWKDQVFAAITLMWLFSPNEELQLC